ncbi:hypothetical protein GCM10011507_33320 [Edaphobacter acidisoli]|uniref:DUF1844 domain-containing protein n=1 Tax=Edaphobacter acidisoli TaxID=2040573 RepID=A0A916S2X5_9BACT|nr:DUF1844 domain-containing protein [Edaphobacter acidisoli]GGA79403.1 hypothetical protein GCM10011507_33320 [Edaphobacter acidisoli]
MSEQNKPFVVTDRRKFTLDGELRPDADPSPEKESKPAPVEAAPPEPSVKPEITAEETAQPPIDDLPPGPTAEQAEQSRRAYEATTERLDTAVRATNPGADHPPAVSFDSLVQSVYMTAIMQLGGATPEGQPPQVDILGARQSIDMLAVLAEKTKRNLTEDESRLLESALFELRMAFLEITQAIARSAAAKAAQGNPAGGPAGPTGPRGPQIVR